MSHLVARAHSARVLLGARRRQVTVPWALPGSRFTLPFERHAIDTLLETDVLGGARVLKLSWDEAWRLMERAVERGQKAKKRRVIPYLGVDEKAVARRHQYVTMVCDLKRGTVDTLRKIAKNQPERVLRLSL